MFCVDIQITNKQKVFYVGDTITGTALVTVPSDFPLSNVALSFHCRGGLKWADQVDMWLQLHNHTWYENNKFLDETFNIDNSKTVIQLMSETSKNISIPFSFPIPMDKELPSTMVSSEGYVRYFIGLTLKPPEEKETKKFYKEVTVLAPFYNNLMITVGASAEKSVLLHSGTVSLHASIGRKGFAPGETITVHVTVDNQTDAKVVPKVSLNQTQIYSSDSDLKILESSLNEETIRGTEVEPHSQTQELLTVPIPEDNSLSIKSSLITVKYFIRVDLDIPHSFDLNVKLPLVITTKAVIEQIHKRKNDQLISN